MIAYLDQRLSLKTVLWLLPLAFILHDLEEVFTMAPWIATHGDALPSLFAGRMHALTSTQVAGAVGVEFLLTVLASFLGVRALQQGRPGRLYVTVVAVLFGNVFTHLGQALFFGGYTPGVWTAPTIALPYTTYALYRLFRADLLTWRVLGREALIGAAIAVPGVLTALQIGRWLFPG